MMPRSIINSFAKCGIFPFDRHIFTDEDFLPSSVTDRLCPGNLREVDASTPDSLSILEEMASTSLETNIAKPLCDLSTTLARTPEQEKFFSVADPAQLVVNESTQPEAGTASDATRQSQSSEIVTTSLSSPSKSGTKPSFTSPFDFRGAIKAGPGKNKRKRRKPGRSLIAPDTPEKTLTEEEKMNKKKNKSTIQKIIESDDEELQLAETDDEKHWLEMPEEDLEDINIITEEDLKNPLPHPPKEGEYVIVQLTSKKQRSLFVGKVIEESNCDLEYYISFLRRKPGTEKFYTPTKTDLSLVREEDLKYILTKPSMVGTTSRPFYNFQIDFTFLCIC